MEEAGSLVLYWQIKKTISNAHSNIETTHGGSSFWFICSCGNVGDPNTVKLVNISTEKVWEQIAVYIVVGKLQSKLKLFII